MENASDRIIEDYIQRVLALRQSQSLQQADLEALAMELGMTAEDIAIAQQKAQDHLTRGKNYGQFQRWDDAIEELKQAVALNPVNRDGLYALAEAHQARYQQKRQATDRAEAITLAKQCLTLGPNDMAAIELINRLDQPNQGMPRLAWIVGGGTGILVVLLGLTVGFLWQKPEEFPPQPEPPLSVSVPEGVGSETTQPSQTLQTTPGQSAVDIPVEFEAAGLAVEPRLSRLNNYSDSSYYKLQGVLVNRSDQELSQLQLQVEYLDAQGNAIATENHKALADSDAKLRPGDTRALNLIEKLNPTLAKVRLTVVTRDQTPAASQYPPAPTVDYGWAFPQPQQLQFAIAARSDQFKEYSADSAYHDAVFAVTNTGEVALTKLKLQLDFYNAQNQVISQEEVLVVYGDDAPLLPGETRPKRSIHAVPPTYASYQVQVVEAE